MPKTSRKALPALLASAGLLLTLGACGQQETHTEANTVGGVGTGQVNAMDDALIGNAMDDGTMDNGMMGNDAMGAGQGGQDGNQIGSTQPNINAPTQPLGTVQPTEHQAGIRPSGQ
jgi:hypothetical protein